MRRVIVALVAGLVVLLAVGSPRLADGAEGTSVADVPLANGATDRTLLMLPPGAPKAVLIMFAGGNGILRISPSGAIGAGGNFLVRTRNLWVQRGFAVVVPDSPSDDPKGLEGRRLTPAYTDAISRIVSFARAQTQMPVWLVGNSAGTPAAALGGATLPHEQLAGVVLTSTVTRPIPGIPEAVFRVDLTKITVPTLILSNTQDECTATPPGDGPRIAAAISNGSTVEFQTVSGGAAPKTGPCDALSYHGFYGIEPQVVGAISDWIIKHS